MSSADPQFERACGDVPDVISDRAIAQGAPSTYHDLRWPVAEKIMETLSESDKREQERPEELFLDANFPYDAIRDLRSSDSALKRVAAARTLGVVGNPLTTTHLIAALFDQAPEVRCAAAEALDELGDPDVAIGSLKSFLGADGGPRVPEETAPAPLAEVCEGVEAGRRPLEDEPGDFDAQGLGDLEQAVVPIDSSLLGLPALTVADLQSADAGKRASSVLEVARSGVPGAFNVITDCFDDHSPDVRNAAALALRELEPPRAGELFSQAVGKASPERCRNIADAMVGSGLAADAINDLSCESRQRAYSALCMLFVMAKIRAVGPLVQAIEEHKSTVVRCAAMRLLNLSGQPEIAEAAVKRRLGI